MIDKYFFNIEVVSEIEESQIFDIVVLQWNLSQTFEIVEVYRIYFAVVGVNKLTFRIWGDCQTTRHHLFEDYYAFLVIYVFGRLVFRLAFSKRAFTF